MKTSIQISKETQQKLKKYGNMGDSYDKVINARLNETQNFKNTITALINVKNYANTSPYKKDIEEEGEQEIVKIEKAINEYKEIATKWDDYYASVPLSIYDIMKLLKYNDYNTYTDQRSIEMCEKIEKMKTDIERQIVEMTLEFTEEED